MLKLLIVLLYEIVLSLQLSPQFQHVLEMNTRQVNRRQELSYDLKPTVKL